MMDDQDGYFGKDVAATYDDGFEGQFDPAVIEVTADALAVTATLLPDTVAPAAGAVIDTVGLLFTLMLTAGDVPLLLPESVATAVKLCTPLVRVVASSKVL